MDPDNHVVKLCAQGMQAKSESNPDLAGGCFRRAWDVARDEYEKCIAAHYVARHRPSEDERRLWNQRALDLAHAVADSRVTQLYPSLLLNLGHSLEVTGDIAQARDLYVRAEESCSTLPEGPYADLVRGRIAAALTRVKDKPGASS